MEVSKKKTWQNKTPSCRWKFGAHLAKQKQSLIYTAPSHLYTLMLLLARKPHSQLVLVVFDYCSHHLDIPKYPCRHRCFFHYVLLQQCMKKRLKLNNLQYIFSGFGILDNNYLSFSKRTASTCCRFFSVYFDLCKFANQKKNQTGTASLAIVGSILEPDLEEWWDWLNFFYWWLITPLFQDFLWGGGNSNIFGIFILILGEDEPILRKLFFNWVETTNQFSLRGKVALFLQLRVPYIIFSDLATRMGFTKAWIEVLGSIFPPDFLSRPLFFHDLSCVLAAHFQQEKLCIQY